MKSKNRVFTVFDLISAQASMEVDEGSSTDPNVSLKKGALTRYGKLTSGSAHA